MTRCNLLIVHNNDFVWIYKHCDGNPEIAGEEIDNFLSKGKNCQLSPKEMYDGIKFMYGDIYEKEDSPTANTDYNYCIYISKNNTRLECRKNDFDTKTNKFFEKHLYYKNYNHEKEDIKKTYTIKELKEMTVKFEYADSMKMTEFKELESFPEHLYIDEETLRKRLVEYVSSKLLSDLSIELINT